jgi:hypothetical protein
MMTITRFDADRTDARARARRDRTRDPRYRH